MRHAVISGIVAGLTAVTVLLLASLAAALLVHRAGPIDRTHGVVIEGGPGGPVTTFTVSQWPTP